MHFIKQLRSMPLLSTHRLHIKEVQISDSVFILNLLNSAGWLKYIGDRGVKTKEDAIRYIQKAFVDNYQKLGFGFYKMVLIEESKPIGICGFAKRDYLEDVDIGFALLPDYEGKGYAYEATKAILDYGLQVLLFKKICAITTLRNSRSQKLLLKLGLQEEKSIQLDGEPISVYQYIGA